MKSFILSSILTAAIAFFFMSLFDNKARGYLNSLSDNLFIVVAVIFFLGYLLALYWGITGIMKEQRILNFMGICLCLFGLGIYLLGFVVNSGGGKATPDQFDHDFTKIESAQHLILDEILQQINTKESEVQFVNYWSMNNNPDGFVICIQKGNIIALQIKDKRVPELKTISKLEHINWLVLENCNISSIADLKLPYLQRLSVNRNQLTNLNGTENEPQLSWINFQDNPITDSSAVKNHPNKSLYILN